MNEDIPIRPIGGIGISTKSIRYQTITLRARPPTVMHYSLQSAAQQPWCSAVIMAATDL